MSTLIRLGLLLATTAFTGATIDWRSTVGDRVMLLTRDSAWRRVAVVPLAFRTFHPQGLVKIGDAFFLSSVEVTTPARRLARPIDGHDRDTGEGIGHLFKLDANGKLIDDVPLGEGSIYHPGGIDYDGAHLWVPVAEYRPDSRSIVYRVDPATLKSTIAFRVSDHIGAIAVDADDRTLQVSAGDRGACTSGCSTSAAV